MSKGFQMESIIKAKYASKGDDNGEEDDEDFNSAENDAVSENEDSFEIIDSMSEGGRSQSGKADEQDENAQKKEDLMEKMKELGDSFDHLSQYDPDDEFLKSSRSFSIIESIVSK